MIKRVTGKVREKTILVRVKILTMKKIKLGSKRGIIQYALVDDDDFQRVSSIKWHILSSIGYAVHTKHIGYEGKKQIQRPVYMHRFIMNTPNGMDTDHINHDRLDNRKENLRVCTRSQNHCNRRHNKSTSGVTGVKRSGNNWTARISIKGKEIHLGTYKTLIEASLARNKATMEYHGEFALLNEYK